MKKKTQQWFQNLKHQLFQSVFSGVIFVLTVIVTITSLVLIGSEVLVGRDVIAADATDRDKFVYGSGENAIGIDIANLNKLLSTNNSYQLTVNMWDTLIGEIKNLGNVVNNQKTIIENTTNSAGSDSDADSDQIYAELNNIYSMIDEIDVEINQLSGKAATPVNIPPTFTYYDGAYDNSCKVMNPPADFDCVDGTHVHVLKLREIGKYITVKIFGREVKIEDYQWLASEEVGNNNHYTFKETILKAHDYCRLAGIGGVMNQEWDEIKVIGNQLTFIHEGGGALRFIVACLNKEKPNVVTYPPSSATSSLDLWSKWTCDIKGAPKCPSGYKSIGTRGSTMWDGASCGLFVDWDERYCVKENKTKVKDGGECIAGYALEGTNVTVSKGKMNKGRCIKNSTSTVSMNPNGGTKNTRIETKS